MEEVLNSSVAKMHDKYLGMTPEEFQVLAGRYISFQESCNDLTKDPVKVFSPLSEKRLAELHLMREVSMELGMKKEEDMKKAAALKAEEAEEKAEEKAEVKTEDNAEEKTPETDK